MGLFRSSDVTAIAEEALFFILDAAADAHPNEYMGLLRAEEASRLDLDRDGLVITDVLVIPGTKANPVSATVKTSMIPNVSRVGSVHSHPNGVLRPSDEDRRTFGTGQVHLIVGAPYGEDDWRAFDRNGTQRDLEVVDVALPDPEDFFDFTESDLDLW